jgi:hypothetical protein
VTSSEVAVGAADERPPKSTAQVATVAAELASNQCREREQDHEKQTMSRKQRYKIPVLIHADEVNE